MLGMILREMKMKTSKHRELNWEEIKIYSENITPQDDIDELKYLHDELEKKNYHVEAVLLYNMIEAIKEKQNDYQSEIIQREWDESIKYYFDKFQNEIKHTFNM